MDWSSHSGPMTKSFISSVATSTSSPTKTPVSIRHQNKSALRQRFIDYLVLQQKARRTVEAYTDWIRHLAAFHHRAPDLLAQPEIRSWLLHLISNRQRIGEIVFAINKKGAPRIDNRGASKSELLSISIWQKVLTAFLPVRRW